MFKNYTNFSSKNKLRIKPKLQTLDFILAYSKSLEVKKVLGVTSFCKLN